MGLQKKKTAQHVLLQTDGDSLRHLTSSLLTVVVVYDVTGQREWPNANRTTQFQKETDVYTGTKT